jgi:hypothetical protein
MQNKTIGVDTSVSSPTSTFVIDEVTANSENVTITHSFPVDLPAEAYYGYIHASNVQYFMSKLLGNALSLVDTSIPNKEQNRAMKHLLRKQFDEAIMDVHKMAWPLNTGDINAMKSQAAATQPAQNGYILQPES